MRRGILSFVGTARQFRAAMKLLVAMKSARQQYWPDIAPRLSASTLPFYIQALRRYGMVQLLSRDRAMHLASMAALVLDGKVAVEPAGGTAWAVRYEP